METNKQTEQPCDLQSIKGLIDQFFLATPHTLVQEELWKWFVFSVSSKGLCISDLQANEFAQFSDQLIKLIEAVYHWANLQKSTMVKLGGHAHA